MKTTDDEFEYNVKVYGDSEGNYILYDEWDTFETIAEDADRAARFYEVYDRRVVMVKRHKPEYTVVPEEEWRKK